MSINLNKTGYKSLLNENNEEKTLKMYKNEKEMLIIGHKNPDTDSICSALSLAELKRAMGNENAVACRAGDINPQTEFIIGKFGIEAPRFVPDVYLKASDIMTSDINAASLHTPIIHVMDMMREKEVRIVPVLDADKKLIGVLTMMELAKKYMASYDAASSKKVVTTYDNIAKTLKGKEVLNFMDKDATELSVFVGAMGDESFSEVFKVQDPQESAVIVGDRESIQKISIEKGVKLLIISGDFKVSDEIKALAEKNKVSIVGSMFDSVTTAHILKMSSPSNEIMSEEFVTVHPNEHVEQLKKKHVVDGTNGLFVVNKDGFLEGVITPSDLLKTSNIQLVLVDHNELGQAVDGADNVEIVEVIDHHRLGNFHTNQPISFFCDPVGSTCTLVAEMYKRTDSVEIKKEIASILLGGVMSDTVLLKSPTTTPRDIDIVVWLEEKSGLKYEDYGKEIFNATASIKKRGHKAVVNGDYKTFTVSGKNFGIGQVETIGFDEFFSEKAGLKDELIKLKEDRNLHLSSLIVTDIVKGTSLLLTVAEDELIENLKYPLIEEDVVELKNILSRKKQVVPHILSVFSETY